QGRSGGTRENAGRHVGPRRSDPGTLSALARRSAPEQSARREGAGRAAARRTRSLDETVERRARPRAAGREEVIRQAPRATGAALTPSKLRTSPASPRRSVCAPGEVSRSPADHLAKGNDHVLATTVAVAEPTRDRLPAPVGPETPRAAEGGRPRRTGGAR